AREARYWIKRALTRRLIPPPEAEHLLQELIGATRQLNGLIRYRRVHAHQRAVHEAPLSYIVDVPDPFTAQYPRTASPTAPTPPDRDGVPGRGKARLHDEAARRAHGGDGCPGGRGPPPRREELRRLQPAVLGGLPGGEGRRSRTRAALDGDGGVSQRHAAHR